MSVTSVAEPATEQALFDSAKPALRFALNHRVGMPRPVMNRMMSETDLKRIRLEDGSKFTLVTKPRSPRSEQLRGLDGAATAGMTLQHFDKLTLPLRHVLISLSVPARLPCGCRSPCCIGERPNQVWGESILFICSYLRDEAQLSRIKGKKGMSTTPVMRMALVEHYFQPERRLDTAALAEQSECTEQTVHNHRRPIHALLRELEVQGWSELDRELTTVGIVGNLY